MKTGENLHEDIIIHQLIQMNKNQKACDHRPFFRLDMKYVFYHQVTGFFQLSVGLTKVISSPPKSRPTYG